MSFEEHLRQDFYSIPLPATASVVDYASPGTEPPNRGWVTFNLQVEDPNTLNGIMLEFATIVRQYQDDPPSGEIR